MGRQVLGCRMMTPVKSIRAYCIECQGGSLKEVRLCTSYDCPLYGYRMGKRPSQDTLATIEKFSEKNR